MKILFPLEGFTLSGGSRIIINIANGLANNGNHVKFIVPDYAAIPPFDLLENISIDVIDTSKTVRFKKNYYRFMLCQLSSFDTDIVFATGFKTPYYIFISKILNKSNAKIVYLIQGYEAISHGLTNSKDNIIKNTIIYLLAVISYRIPSTKITVSNWLKNKINISPLTVIPNGIELNIFKPITIKEYNPAKKHIIGVFASKIENKGFEVFKKAIQLMTPDELDKIKLLIASHDAINYPPGVETEIVKPTCDSDLVVFYNRSDVFVFNSYCEGFGLPPLEAMACGTSVIVTDCGGISEYANKENSIMVPVGDQYALLNAIRTLIKNSELKAELEINALEVAKQYTLNRMTSAYCALIESI